MWPQGLGLMLYNGADGLIYYSDKAARVFVANMGIVTTIAVSGYIAPGKTAAGLAGAVAIRGATWLTKAVDKKYEVHLADIMDTFLMNSPPSVVAACMKAFELAGKPQRKVSTAIGSTPRLSWINESLKTELMSPLLEEAIFRAGLQEGMAFGLAAVGVPRPVAVILTGTISASLFAGAHNVDAAHPQHRDTLVSGIGFELMMYLHGMPGAVVAHAANNAAIRLGQALRALG